MEMVKIVQPEIVDQTGLLHIWRSKFFDKASKCERELRRILALPANDKTHFKMMAEKLLTSKKPDKNTPLAKLVEELIPLIELRAELAHSHFVGFGRDQATVAFFENACFTHVHFKKLTVLSEDQRKKAYDRLSSIAGQLAKVTI